MRMELGGAALVITASLLSLACDTTSPSAETAEQAGAVIGHSACFGVAAFVKRGTVVSSLPRPAGLGTNGSVFPLEINLDGRIVGYRVPGDGTYNLRALQGTPSGAGHTVLDLGTMTGGAAAEARAINAAGDVVGWSEIAMAGGVIRKHGFLRRANGTRIDLVPANGYLNAAANDINPSGFGVGKRYTPIQGGAHSSRATIWKPASSGSNTLLPVILAGDFRGTAEAINAAGAIVGSITIAGSPSLTHLARWQVNGITVEDLSPGDPYAVGYDVGTSGLIVGERIVSGRYAAFAFGTRFTNLPNPASVRSFATGVNQCGTIVGQGRQTQAGSTSPVQVAAQRTQRYLACSFVIP